MGNQNTSGIAEEKATSEAPEIARVSSAHDQQEEVDQTVIGDGEGEAAEKGPLQTSLEVSEEHEGSVKEGPETQTNELLNGSIDHEGLKETTCFEEERTEFNDEMQDQPCTFKEEMQTSEIANSTPKSTSEIADPDSSSVLDSADITSEAQEDRDTLEMIKNLLLDDEKPTTNELVNGGERRSCADQDTDHCTDNEVEIGSNHSDKIGLADEKAPKDDQPIFSDETTLENAVITSTSDVGSNHSTDKIGLSDEKAPQDDQHISSDETTLENAVITTTSDVCSNHGSDKISLPDEEAPQDDQHLSSNETTLENAAITTTKKQGNEYPTSDVGPNHGSGKASLPDEKAPQDDHHISSDETILENVVTTTTKEQGNKYPTSDVGPNHGSDKTSLPDEKAPQDDQHISSDETILENVVITTTKKQGNKYPTFDVGSNHGLVSLPDEKAPQDDQHISSEETALENVVITTTKKQGNKYPTSDVGSNHSTDKIGLPDEKAPQEDQHISSDETILENAVITTTRKQRPTSDICEKLDIGSSVDPSYQGSRVELRKFPSFDFRLERTEESDRTPLLYNDNSGATPRSFSSRSSSSALRFQNRSIQIEHYEAVEAQEKTIRIERSSTTADLPLNQQNNNSVSDKEKGIGSKGSTPSTKGSGKQKPRSSSSLFTTCLCCTAEIN